MTLLEELRQSVIGGEADITQDLVHRSLVEGLPPNAFCEMV